MVTTSGNTLECAYRDILLYVDDALVHTAAQQSNGGKGRNHASTTSSSSIAQLCAVLRSFSSGREFLRAGAVLEPLQRRFEVMARTTPSAIAVACNGRRLTYGELDEQADALALHLQGIGLAPRSFCVVDLEPSVAHLRAVLAVLKAGAACLQIDRRVAPAAFAAVLAVVKPSLCLTRLASPAPAPADGNPDAPRAICCDEDATDLPYGWANELPVGARTPACAFASISHQGNLCISVRTHHAIGASLERNHATRRTQAADADADADANTSRLWRPLSRGAQITIPA